MKRSQRERLAIVRDVLEPLGCTVSEARHNTHLVLAIQGPAGQRLSLPLSGTPKNEWAAIQGSRRDAQRIAKTWGLQP